MFFRGFLIGLVAGVWLTVIYMVITTRGHVIRAYFNSSRKSTVPAPQREKVAVASTSIDRRTTLGSSATAAQTATQTATQSHARSFDPAQLSARGASSFDYLVRLTHDEQTAQRLVQYEARRQPGADIDQLIDRAIASLLHDRL